MRARSTKGSRRPCGWWCGAGKARLRVAPWGCTPSRVVRTLTFAELDQEADAYDAQVARTDEIDRFCTSSAWLLSAQEAFCPEARPLITASPAGYVVLMSFPMPNQGPLVATPLEVGWGLGTGFATARPMATASQLRKTIESLEERPKVLFLSGLLKDGRLWRALMTAFGHRARFGQGPGCLRCTASLEDGLDGFLSRRSAKFRANVRRATRSALARGLSLEYLSGPFTADEARALMLRVRAIEERSWKGRSGHGFNLGAPFVFYSQMAARLGPRGALRCLFARHEGRDVAFAFGGFAGAHFRGLQMSYDQDYEPWSLGNVVQLALIERLCQEGAVAYELGTDMAYKHHWSEGGLLTHTLAIFLDI